MYRLRCSTFLSRSAPIVPTYNVPSLTHAVRFTREALVGIFLGTITTWDDPKIVSANADLAIKHLPLVVVHRSDGSGTTYVWTDYLSKISPEWRSRVGVATSVSWPVGQSSPGNDGVARTIHATPGSIGYLELTYAIASGMPAGQLENSAGRFVDPSVESVTAAAMAALPSVPPDMRFSMTGSDDEKAWPASGTTWAIIDRDMPAGPRRALLVSVRRWVVGKGQADCAALHYAPLPSQLAEAADAKLRRMDAAP